MRLKLLSLFLAIQTVSFAIWNFTISEKISESMIQNEPQIHPSPTVISRSSVDLDESYEPHYAAKNLTPTSRYLNPIKKNQVQTALDQLPEEHVRSIKTIVLDYNEQAHRGLGGNGLIVLRALNMSSEEFIAVLIHELAHNVDYAYLEPKNVERKSPFVDGKTPLYETDPSLDFYRVSWLSNGKKKSRISNTDFVSGYAMKNPHEDFAETYAYYVLHNKDFKALSASSDALLAKYRFMKYRVFDGQEFDTGDGQVKMNNRPWDITVMSYDLSSFMG